MKISVAMAYYNGKDYIKEQLNSILEQLQEDDEVIISMDGAEDGSEQLLLDLAKKDSRIRLIDGPKQGVVRNFENALMHCQGEIIFLSDQDDVWVKGKVKKILRGFEKSGAMAILHNGMLVDENDKEIGGKTLFELRKSRPGIGKNLIKNSYVGCCMAFRRELLAVILPIPQEMYMHDYWIGTAAEMAGGVAFIKEPLIRYRRHGANVTQMRHGSIGFMIKKRFDIIKCLRILRRRLKENRNHDNE